MTRLGYTAELGYELWVERERAFDLWDALLLELTPAGDEGDRHGRARPVPDRRRLHHRRRRVRPDRVARTSAASAGRSTSTRASSRGVTASFAIVTQRVAPARERRARLGRRRGERRAALRRRGRGRARHAGGRVALPRRPDARAREDPARAEGRRDEGGRPGRREAEVPGEVVEHPVYDKERRRAKELA